jgi:hypothetical protein
MFGLRRYSVCEIHLHRTRAARCQKHIKLDGAELNSRAAACPETRVELVCMGACPATFELHEGATQPPRDGIVTLNERPSFDDGRQMIESHNAAVKSSVCAVVDGTFGLLISFASAQRVCVHDHGCSLVLSLSHVCNDDLLGTTVEGSLQVEVVRSRSQQRVQ